MENILKKSYRMFINGEWVNSSNGVMVKSYAPYNNELLSEFPDASESDVDLAVKSAKEAFKTFTSDRGKEFSCWKKVEEMGIDFYFADPYCSWQRGCNENSNGLLREFYPKKTDISKVETEDLLRTLMLINSRPRKCLNYATPFEKFLHEISL